MNFTHALFALAILGPSLLPAQSKEIKDGMKDAYEKMAEAYNKRDVKAVMGMTSGDFEWVLLDGTKVKRDKTEASLKELFAKVNEGKWTVKLTNILGGGSVANTTAEFNFKGTMLDMAKRPYKVEITTVERQVWNEDKSGWHQTKSEMISQRTVNDQGKVIPNVYSGASGAGGKG